MRIIFALIGLIALASAQTGRHREEQVGATGHPVQSTSAHKKRKQKSVGVTGHPAQSTGAPAHKKRKQKSVGTVEPAAPAPAAEGSATCYEKAVQGECYDLNKIDPYSKKKWGDKAKMSNGKVCFALYAGLTQGDTTSCYKFLGEQIKESKFYPDSPHKGKETPITKDYFWDSPEFVSFWNGDHYEHSVTTITKKYYHDIENLCRAEGKDGLKKMLDEGKKQFHAHFPGGKGWPTHQCFHFPNGVPTGSTRKCNQDVDGCASVPYIHMHTFLQEGEAQVDWNMPGDAKPVAPGEAKLISRTLINQLTWQETEAKLPKDKRQFDVGICVNGGEASDTGKGAEAVCKMVAGDTRKSKAVGAAKTETNWQYIGAAAFLCFLGFYTYRTKESHNYEPLLVKVKVVD